MRKLMVFILTALLLMGAGYALAQQEGQTTPPGQTQPPLTMMGSQDIPQLMQKLQDNMQ